jgi:hypothetical protein
MLARRASADEIGMDTGLPPALIQHCIDLGLIVPQTYYSEAERRELRRMHRLIDDLGIDAEAVEVLLRMRRRIVALQREVARLQLKLRSSRPQSTAMAWIDAEWTDNRR